MDGPFHMKQTFDSWCKGYEKPPTWAEKNRLWDAWQMAFIEGYNYDMNVPHETNIDS